MTINIQPPISPFKGTINLPSSKSISNRALTINALTGRRECLPDNVSDCDDIGAAGTAMRFSSALLAVTEGTRIITGSERMRHRPISVLVDALRQLGAEVEYTGEEGFPPLRITGHNHLPGGELHLPGNVSSQYISALLMVGPVMERGLTLHLEGDIISRPYIDLTLKMMRDFGGKACWTDERTITVSPQGYVPIDYHVESDWSAASYWYETVALSSDFEVCLPVLFADSYQGDSQVARIFERLGVKTAFVTDNKGMKSVTLCKTPCTVERLECDLVNQPDLAQTLVVTCCMMGVPFRFTGLQSLRIKETDRIAALEQELARHLRRPPYGYGLRTLRLETGPYQHQQPTSGQQILPSFLGRPQTSGFHHQRKTIRHKKRHVIPHTIPIHPRCLGHGCWIHPRKTKPKETGKR